MAEVIDEGEAQFRRPDPVAAGRALAYAEMRRVVSALPADEPLTRTVLLAMLAGLEAAQGAA